MDGGIEMASKTSRDLRRVRKQAAKWVVALHTRDDIRPLLPAFTQWVNAQPSHRTEFKKLNTAWEVVQDMRNRGQPGDPHPVVPLGPVSRPLIAPRSWKRPVAVATVLTVLGAVALGGYRFVYPTHSLGHSCPAWLPFRQALCTLSRGHYAAEPGYPTLLELSDGSEISLYSESEVALDVTTDHREVSLDRGKSLFHVRAALAPFVVKVGHSSVQALGTTFSVDKQGPESSQTEIQDGKVSVVAAEQAAPVVVEAGQVVEIQDGKIQYIRQTTPKVDDSVPEAPEVLSFDSEYLSEAAQKFNRYNRRKLRVDPKIAPVRIGGSFPSKDPEGFAAALERMLGIKHSDFHDSATGEDVIYLHGPVPSGSGLRPAK